MTVFGKLGVQFTIQFYGGRELYRFIDRSNIKDVILNEGVSVFRVVYYMAFIVDGRDKLDVAFQVNKESDTQTFCSLSYLVPNNEYFIPPVYYVKHFLPRLNELLPVLSTSYSCVGTSKCNNFLSRVFFRCTMGLGIYFSAIVKAAMTRTMRHDLQGICNAVFNIHKL